MEKNGLTGDTGTPATATSVVNAPPSIDRLNSAVPVVTLRIRKWMLCNPAMDTADWPVVAALAERFSYAKPLSTPATVHPVFLL
jgi:hypothetical protein